MKFRARRHPCSYKSDLKIGESRARVVLRDVTPEGARVECGPSDLQGRGLGHSLDHGKATWRNRALGAR